MNSSSDKDEMGLFSRELSNVVEWKDYKDDILMWKWDNDEIKKGSKLIIRPGQDAIFMSNGVVEGVFEDEGNYDIETQIVPFLSTLKGFKFGFNSGMRAEVVFINTKEITVKWGTKNAVMIPAAGLPGGMPIRAFGTFSCKVADHSVLIDKIAGIKRNFTIDDVKERVVSSVDQLLMKWIASEGKDMFNLQVNSAQIAKGIREDLDMEMFKIGIGIPMFSISSFSYPEEIQKMAEKAAAQSMVGDVNKYQQIAFADGMTNGKGSSAGDMAGAMAGMQMGAMMGQQMANNMSGGGKAMGAPQAGAPAGAQAAGGAAKFCPNCGTKTDGAKFCPNCGAKLG